MAQTNMAVVTLIAAVLFSALVFCFLLIFDQTAGNLASTLGTKRDDHINWLLAKQTQLQLFVVLLSTLNDVDVRLKLRQSWLTDVYIDETTLPVRLSFRFFISLPTEDSPLPSSVDEEIEEYDDIVCVQALWETSSFVQIIKWIEQNVADTDYIVIANSNSFVRLDVLADALAEHDLDQVRSGTEHVYAGKLISNEEVLHPPRRDNKVVAWEDFPMNTFPPYVHASLVVLSTKLAFLVAKEMASPCASKWSLGLSIGLLVESLRHSGIKVNIRDLDRIYLTLKDSRYDSRKLPYNLLALHEISPVLLPLLFSQFVLREISVRRCEDGYPHLNKLTYTSSSASFVFAPSAPEALVTEMWSWDELCWNRSDALSQPKNIQSIKQNDVYSPSLPCCPSSCYVNDTTGLSKTGIINSYVLEHLYFLIVQQ